MANEDKPSEEKPVANEDKPSEEKNGKNEELTEKKEEAANALPSEKLVGVFAEHYGLRFSKTPTVKQLAEIAEIPYTSFSQALNALKKKSEEILKDVPSVTNSKENTASIDEALKGF